MIIVIPGQPIHKKRHRYHVRGGHVGSYDPQDKEKKSIGFAIQAQARNAIQSEIEAYHVEFEFYVQIPASLSKSKRNLLLWYKPANEKPDIDNLVKFYLDAATSVLWTDDKQIVSIKATKHYSENPRTVIRIIGAKSMKLDEKTEGILSIFSSSMFDELIEDCFVLCERVSDTSQMLKEDELKFKAHLISLFANLYGDELRKVKRAYPSAPADHIAGADKMIHNILENSSC